MAQTSNPIKTAAIIFFITALLGLALIGIHLLPIPAWGRWSLTLVIVLAAYLAARSVSAANWERNAKRRAASILLRFGALLIARGSAGLFLTIPNVLARFSEIHRDAIEKYEVQIELVAGGPWALNLAFVFIGFLMLAAVLYYQPRRTAINQESLQRSPELTNWSSGEEAPPTYDSDLPPLVEHWVGRISELELITERSNAVVALTGIGGQGKSALAAKALMDYLAINPRAFWDWRDCREESDRFRT